MSTDFLDSLKEDDIFVKITSNTKLGGGISIRDVSKVIDSLDDSYRAFIEVEYEKFLALNYLPYKNTKDVIKENSLIITGLKFESFGMSFAPNTTTYKDMPLIPNPLDWKKNCFGKYKKMVFQENYDNDEYIKSISTSYTREERFKIFKPIFDGIINNKDSKIEFNVKEKANPIHLTIHTIETKNALIPDISLNVSDDFSTSVALVKVNNVTRRTSVVTLFEGIELPVIKIDTIKYGDVSYSLKHSIYCEISREDEVYFLDNEQLGIHTAGQSIEEARESFSEEFDYIYKRYNELSNESLTDDVITIKNYLNLLV